MKRRGDVEDQVRIVLEVQAFVDFPVALPSLFANPIGDELALRHFATELKTKRKRHRNTEKYV